MSLKNQEKVNLPIQKNSDEFSDATEAQIR